MEPRVTTELCYEIQIDDQKHACSVHLCSDIVPLIP